jgi:hypothetical protein
VVGWFEWSKKARLGVVRMEDLVLVSGRTLVTSWGAAVFLDHGLEEAAISLADHVLPNGGGRFVWGNIDRVVPHHNSRLESVRSPVCAFFHRLIFLLSYQKDNSSLTMNQCVFIRGFRAKRGFPWLKRIRAAAEPLPDDPENSHEDEIEVTGVPDDQEVGHPHVVRR